MIQIQTEQISALQQQSLQAFYNRLDRHLIRFYKEIWLGFSPEERSAMMRQGLAEARQYGLRKEGQVMIWFNLKLSLQAIGVCFPHHPALRAILDRRDLSPEQLLQHLIDTTLQILDEHAVQN